MKKNYTLRLAFIALLFVAVSCSEPEIIKPDPKYKVGDVITINNIKGVVFFVDFDGEHGKMVALTETLCKWSQNFTETGATDLSDGSKNMATIMKIDNWKMDYPAFYYPFNIQQSEVWYLPAKEEMELLLSMESYINQAILESNGKELRSDHEYWTSTEISAEQVNVVTFTNQGAVLTDKKDKNSSVTYTRSIRKF